MQRSILIWVLSLVLAESHATLPSGENSGYDSWYRLARGTCIVRSHSGRHQKSGVIPRSLSFNSILNWRVADSRHQWTPNARSIVGSSLTRRGFLASFAWSSAGTELITSLLFDVNLRRRNPPRLHNNVVFLISSYA